MGQAGNPGLSVGNFFQINISMNNTCQCSTVRHHVPPRIHNQRMAKAFATTWNFTNRTRGHNEDAVFDGARPIQDMPMCLAGSFCERGGYADNFGAGLRQFAIELRKPEIITNGMANAPRRCVS